MSDYATGIYATATYGGVPPSPPVRYVLIPGVRDGLTITPGTRIPPLTLEAR